MSEPIEASKPDRGSFVKFDSEGQSEIRIQCDSTQKEKVKKLLEIPYGETFLVEVKEKK